MGPVASTALGDLRRRRLQTIVLALVLFLASAAATLALNILVASHEPFERAFARANGAHLVIDYHGSVDPAALTGTSATDVVTASAGPWPIAQGALGYPAGGLIGDMAMSGRGRPDASIDNVTISAGRWWERAGEAVVGQEVADQMALQPGDTLAVYPPPTRSATEPPSSGGDKARLPAGKTDTDQDMRPAATLTVVGIARSVSTPDTAVWMSPADITSLTPGVSPEQQMLYRVEPSGSQADLAAATAQITGGLDAAAVANVSTYLAARAGVNDTADLYVPILLAFSVFALAAAAFTIANVVSGIVLTGYRDLGVMKAIGFTPSQVSWILLIQILLPVAVGALLGTAAGVLGSISTVERLARSFGLPGAFELAVPVVVAVPIIGVAVSLLAAAGPALHAGRLSVVAAITRGTAPSRRPDGGRLRRLGLRLPVALPMRLGIATGLAHPVRAAMALGALLVGVAALTFAVGVNLSLVRIVTQIERSEASPVRVEAFDPEVDTASVTQTIADLDGTDRSVALAHADVTLATAGVVPFVGYDGDASWLGYELIRGRWFAGPGEVVGPTNLFVEAGLQLGDTVTIAGSGGTITVRIVGETFEIAGERSDDIVVRGTWADLHAVAPSARASSWEVRPDAGIQPSAYTQRLVIATGGIVDAFTLESDTTDEEFLLFLSVVAAMGAVLVAISFGGVFNTVLLETRQRTREMAVLKSLGLAPAQVVMMVVAAVVPLGLLAGLIGLPLGMVFQRAVLSYMGQTAGKTGIPDSTFDVFGPVLFIALAASGLAIAVAGAYIPAQRAAAARIAPVLQAE